MLVITDRFNFALCGLRGDFEQGHFDVQKHSLPKIKEFLATQQGRFRSAVSDPESAARIGRLLGVDLAAHDVTPVAEHCGLYIVARLMPDDEAQWFAVAFIDDAEAYRAKVRRLYG
jgi:hypothetical protein